ncbi:MAG: membrane protein insertion efficiency factor YidD [Candidatus Marinimicrobia bacterium]|nr:membrane protein insertion efficiency factor YidD [Candidatus Neomarinimicrobiota bacterium]MDP7336301.1 membrane protein insertion efficiency factor YidD [Candidatus Neomarinimicrobiota bacterium]
MIRKFFIPILLLGLTVAQYPADSLYVNSKNSILQKILLYPITQWQRLSYNETYLNCQFAPSCSNYGAQAIHTHGAIKGIFMASDRIIRCNPNAFQSHQKMGGQFHKDGRLFDPIKYSHTIHSTKSPIVAAGLSMVIPGLGRAYAGRPIDGFYGFLLSAMAIRAGAISVKNKNVFAPLYVGMAITFYGGETYGAYRTAKYYQK